METETKKVRDSALQAEEAESGKEALARLVGELEAKKAKVCVCVCLRTCVPVCLCACVHRGALRVYVCFTVCAPYVRA